MKKTIRIDFVGFQSDRLRNLGLIQFRITAKGKKISPVLQSVFAFFQQRELINKKLWAGSELSRFFLRIRSVFKNTDL